jgi:hypothetical protein
LVASTMAFSWSRWNTEVNDREKIVIQAAEHLTDEQLAEVRYLNICNETLYAAHSINRMSFTNKTTGMNLAVPNFYSQQRVTQL